MNMMMVLVYMYLCRAPSLSGTASAQLATHRQQPVNRRPSTQFLGPIDSLTLSGVLCRKRPEAGCHYWRWNKWLNWARHGLWIEGSGTIYGMFVIESLSQTKTEFFASGMPSIEFTITPKRVDESPSCSGA